MNLSLTNFAWLSIVGAVVTITLKTVAYLLTGSVGLFSDALESVVNLVAALIALWALWLAQKPPDEEHSHGHSKAEYFSSMIEGILIFVAALSIGFAAVKRIMHPQHLNLVGLGILFSIIATLVNLIIAVQLFRAGKKYHSITLEADAHHLLTDVWTSVGVVVGVGIVAVTHINILDPLVALLVSANIIYIGYQLIKRSALGFLDTEIPAEERKKITAILDNHIKGDFRYHALRTRQSGARKFVSVHILVPGKWTVQQGHDLLENIEEEICQEIPNATVFTHLEPVEDPKSFNDIPLARTF